MIHRSSFVLVLLFIAFSQSANAVWYAYADFTRCPRKHIANTSGQEGPFASQFDCQARIDRAKRESPDLCTVYTCKEATGSNTSSNSAEPGHQMDQHITNAISAGMSGQISAGDAVGLATMGVLGNAILGAGQSQPLTPEQQAAQAEAQRQAQEKARQEAEKARLEEEAYQNSQDEKAFAFLDFMASASAPTGKAKPAPNTDFKPKILCKGGEPGLYTCHVLVCGGSWGGDPVCCPDGYPKLNECDCNCYRANADFECKRYAACQYSYTAPKTADAK